MVTTRVWVRQQRSLPTAPVVEEAPVAEVTQVHFGTSFTASMDGVEAW